MKQTCTILIILVGGFYCLNGQSISRSVIASTGSYTETGSMSLSSTTGEVMVETYSSSSHVLTQGFQQPNIQDSGGQDTTGIQRRVKDGNMTLYPNPVVNQLTVEITAPQPEQYNIHVLDVLGRSVKVPTTQTVEKGTQRFQVNMRDLSPGMYFIRLLSADRQTTRTYKVNKVNY